MLKIKNRKLNKLYIYQAFWLVLIIAAVWGLIYVSPGASDTSQANAAYIMSKSNLP